MNRATQIGFLGGGNIYHDRGMGVVWVPNITPDRDTGIGKRTLVRQFLEAEVAGALHVGDDVHPEPVAAQVLQGRGLARRQVRRCRAGDRSLQALRKALDEGAPVGAG